MAPKSRIRISKDVNLNDDQEQEDPPTASKEDRFPGASNQRGIWKERARASKWKGISKAREDPPTSSSADTTMKRRHSCSHPSSSFGACDVCEELLPEICGVPYAAVAGKNFNGRCSLGLALTEEIYVPPYLCWSTSHPRASLCTSILKKARKVDRLFCSNVKSEELDIPPFSVVFTRLLYARKG